MSVGRFVPDAWHRFQRELFPVSILDGGQCPDFWLYPQKRPKSPT